MSVLNRLEVINFLNVERVNPGSPDWTPHWRCVPLTFGGVSTAVKIHNGGGKTSVCDAIYALLTRSPDLVRKTRERCAGRSWGYYTHIRLEVTYETRTPIQPRLIGHEVVGEHYVLGLYGYADDEKLNFYLYKGCLEDLPVARHEGSKQIIVPNKEFDELRKSMKMECDPGTRRDTWRERVHEHIDGHTLDKAAHYHSKGGGDGAEGLFTVNAAGGRFDTAFFYDHIAPEVLVGCMQEDGEPDEYRFEDTLVNSALPLVEAERKLRKTKADLGEWEDLFGHLTQAHVAVEKYNEAQRERRKVATKHMAEARWLEGAVLTQPLPGVPAPSEQPGEQTRFVADRLVVDDGQWLVPDATLAHLFDIRVSALNERAGGIGLSGVRLGSQVIENPADLKISIPRQGNANRGYDLNQAKALVEKSTKFAEGWDQGAALRALNYAFEFRQGAGECNPFRARARAADLDQRAHEARLKVAKAEKDSAETELSEVSGRLSELQAAESELQRMEASGLFTAAELESPLATGKAVESEKAELKRRETATQQRQLDLQSGRNAYHEVAAQFPGEGPEAALVRLETKESAAAEADVGARSREDATTQSLDRASEDAKDFEGKVATLERVHADLEHLHPLVTKFTEAFGDENWQDLRTSIEAEYQWLIEKRASLDGKITHGDRSLAELVRLRDAASGFSAIFDGEPVEDLVARVTKALGDTETRQQRLAEEARSHKQRRGELETDQADYVAMKMRFGDVDVLTLEDSLRVREQNARSGLSEVTTEIKHLIPKVAHLDWFAVEFGETASPLEIRELRAQQAAALAGVIITLGQRLADRQRDIEEWQAAGTASGSFARQALQATGADVRVHDVVGALGLPADRLRAVLTQFSQVLHAPVYEQAAEAEIALRCLEEARVDFPVFNRLALEAYCRNRNAPGEGAQWLLWGRQSPSVEALVDPSTVALRIAQAQDDCDELEADIAGQKVQADALHPTSKVGRRIEDACRGFEAGVRDELASAESRRDELQGEVDELEELLSAEVIAQIDGACKFQNAGGEGAIRSLTDSIEQTQEQLKEVEAALPELQRRASPEAIKLIEHQSTFLSRGGQDALDALSEKLEGRRIEKNLADRRWLVVQVRHRQLDLVDAKVHFELLGGVSRFAGARSEIESARAAAASAADMLKQVGCEHKQAREAAKQAANELRQAENELSSWSYRLGLASDYVRKEGIGFDEAYAGTVEALKKALDRCDDKLRIRFDLAEDGAKSRCNADYRSEALARRSKLTGIIAQLSTEIGVLDTVISECRTTVAFNNDEARKLDGRVSALIARWHEATQVIEALRGEVLTPPDDDGGSLHLRAARELADDIRKTGDDMANLFQNMDDMVGNVERFEMRRGLDSFNTLRKEEKNAINAVDREAKQVAVNKGSRLTDDERARIDPALQSDHKLLMANIDQLHGLAYEQVHRLQELTRNVGSDVAQHEERFHLSMSGFTQQIRENFRELKRLLKPSQDLGGAGLHIEAEVVGDEHIDAAARQVVQIIRDDLDMRESRGYRTYEQTEAGRKKHKEVLRDRIGREFYRAVFIGPHKNESGPSVKLQHPAIASGKPTRLPDNLSTGQKNSVYLMAIMKLADFAQARDAARDGGVRRRVRPSRVLMIDGLFSNLSDPHLIQPSMEELKQLRGQFQLIGWIHVPQYENDPTLFPSFVQLRRSSLRHGFVVKGEEVIDGTMVPIPLRVQQLAKGPA